MHIGRYSVVVLITSCLCATYPAALPQGSTLKGRGVWAGEYDKVAPRLDRYAPELAGALRTYLADPKDAGVVQQRLQAFLGNIPPGYYAPEKLSRTMDTVRKTGVEGIVIFSAGGIRSAGLWDTVGKSFSGEF